MTPALLATLALAIAGDRRTTNELRNRLGVTQAADLPPWPRWLRHALHGASAEAVILAFDFVTSEEPGFWWGRDQQAGRERLDFRVFHRARASGLQGNAKSWRDFVAEERATLHSVVLRAWMRDPDWTDDSMAEILPRCRTWEELQEAFPPDLYGPVMVGLSVAVDRLLKAGQPGVPPQATWVPTMGQASIWPPTMQVDEAGQIVGYTPAPPSEDIRQVLLVAGDGADRVAVLREVMTWGGRRPPPSWAQGALRRTIWLPAAAQRQPFTSVVALPGSGAPFDTSGLTKPGSVLVPLASGHWREPWQESGLKLPPVLQNFRVLAHRRLASDGAPGEAAWSAEAVLAWHPGLSASQPSLETERILGEHVSGLVYAFFIVDMGETAAPIIERALLDRPAYSRVERWSSDTRIHIFAQPWMEIGIEAVTEAISAAMRARVDDLVALQRMRPGFPQVGLQGLGEAVASVVRGRTTRVVLPQSPSGPGWTPLDPMRPELDPYLRMPHLVVPANALPLSAWDLAAATRAIGWGGGLTATRIRSLLGLFRGWTKAHASGVALWRLPPMETFIALAMFRMAEHRTTIVDFLVTEEGRAFLRTSPTTFTIQAAAEAWHRRLAQAAAQEQRERVKALSLARALAGTAPFLSVETPVGPVLVFDLTPEDLAEESAVMGHCVGTSPVYKRGVERGTTRILSVRLPPGTELGGRMLLRAGDAQGVDRIFTLEVRVKDRSLLQMKGPSDVMPTRQAGRDLSPEERKEMAPQLAQEQALRFAMAMAVVDALRARGDISAHTPPDLRP